jgi:hypothetical protein
LFWRKATEQGVDEVSAAILGGIAAENRRGSAASTWASSLACARSRLQPLVEQGIETTFQDRLNPNWL